MDIHPQILIFGGSLIAIFALFALAKLLKLGGEPVLMSESDAARAAGEVIDGFETVETLLDANGKSALVRDEKRRIVLIKRHGNRFAGRELGDCASAGIVEGGIRIDSGEAVFGSVRLETDDGSPWVRAINRLSEARNA